MRRKRSLHTGRAGDNFGQMGRRGDNTPLPYLVSHGWVGRRDGHPKELLHPALVRPDTGPTSQFEYVFGQNVTEHNPAHRPPVTRS